MTESTSFSFISFYLLKPNPFSSKRIIKRQSVGAEPVSLQSISSERIGFVSSPITCLLRQAGCCHITAETDKNSAFWN